SSATLTTRHQADQGWQEHSGHDVRARCVRLAGHDPAMMSGWSMRRTHRRASGAFIACLASVASLLVGTVACAQERTAQSIVDGVVDAVCRKQIVLLGELPTHGEAHAFDAKSKIADRLIAQCGFTAILFEAGIYDFIGLERAADTRTATPEQLDNAIGRFWWTRELTPWRRALFEATTRQRVVVGDSTIK